MIAPEERFPHKHIVISHNIRYNQQLYNIFSGCNVVDAPEISALFLEQIGSKRFSAQIFFSIYYILSGVDRDISAVAILTRLLERFFAILLFFSFIRSPQFHRVSSNLCHKCLLRQSKYTLRCIYKLFTDIEQGEGWLEDARYETDLIFLMQLAELTKWETCCLILFSVAGFGLWLGSVYFKIHFQVAILM